MKNRILLIFLSVFFWQHTNAQEKLTDTQILFRKALSFHYTNKDSAYFYYEKSIVKASEKNDIKTLLDSYYYLINVNGNHYDLKNYHNNIIRQEYVLFNDKRLDTFSALDDYKNLLLFNKGNYYYKIKQYATSKKHFKTLLEKVKKQQLNKTNIGLLSSTYVFLGAIYKNTNKFEQAKSFYDKNTNFVLKYKDSFSHWESKINNTKKLKSRVYIAKKEFNNATKNLEEVLDFYKTKVVDPRYKNNFISTYKTLAKNEISQKKYVNALQILNRNDHFFKKDNPFETEINVLYGDAYLGLGNYQKSETIYTKTIKDIKAVNSHKKHKDIANVYLKLGKLYSKQQHYEKALSHIQLTLTQLDRTFNNLEIAANPNPKNVVSKTDFIRALKEKLATLLQVYKDTKNSNYLNDAHNVSKIIIETLDLLRPEFETKVDKQFLLNQTYPSIQKAVEVAYELYYKTNDKQYIEDAFYFMEKSKSILLLETQRNTQAYKYGGIPQTIITDEQHFRANISHLEKEIFENKLPKNTLKDSLFSLQNKYRNYIAKIEENYPNYYALKYKSNVISSQETKKMITKNEALLNFLVVDETVYLIIIDQKKEAFYKLPFDQDIQSAVKNLYQKSSNLNISDATLFKDSYTVYSSILKQGLLETDATSLIIVADDILNYIPFDALNTSSNKIEFLLNSHSISYASSATTLQEQTKKRNDNKNKLLVFAPKFTGKTTPINYERTDLTPLLYNTHEAKNIAQYFHGKVLTGANASITNFNSNQNKYNLLHFATHASMNDQFSDYSYLAFSSDSTAANLLYVKDIYNYNINANLVTLSACETGVGKLQKGEGMISLARAFNYAGVPAIVTTLWKINDQSTSEIMGYFYKNLYNGLSKKEALRQAKLSYLEFNDDPLLQHPYYWSGIVLTGNTLAIESKSILIYLLLGTFILIIIRALYKKLKQPSY